MLRPRLRLLTAAALLGGTAWAGIRDHRLPSTGGGELDLGGRPGAPLALMLFRPGCAACVRQFASFARFTALWGQGLESAAVGVESSMEEVRAELKARGWTGPAAVATPAFLAEAGFGGVTPVTLLASPDGKKWMSVTGPRSAEALAAFLRGLLAPEAPAAAHDAAACAECAALQGRGTVPFRPAEERDRDDPRKNPW